MAVAIMVIAVNSFAQKTGTFKDTRDGKVYKTTKIGDQVWMAENLNAITFRNGDTIPEVRSSEEWEKAGKEGRPAWCYMSNDTAKSKKFGKLYNWWAVKDPRGLAPKGWHVPDDKEWTELWNVISVDKEPGKELKDTCGWRGDHNGTNKYGFAGRPGGLRFSYGPFDYVGIQGDWWSTTRVESGSAIAHVIDRTENQDTFSSTFLNVGDGCSVRCIKDK